MDGELRVANPAFRFGAQQLDKLRAVDDLKRSATNAATLIKTPINLPSWDHLAQICLLFDQSGESRLLAIAKADRADASTQLPLKKGDGLAAASALKNPLGEQ